jgi:hypothetical protein
MGSAIDPAVLRTRPGRPTTLTKDSKRLLRTLRRRSRASGRLSPVAYNLTISHTHRFVWFRVAKVGTRSIFNYLKEHDITTEMYNASRTPFPTVAFADYFKFGFVRHPLDRFISAWQDKVHRQNHFRFDEETLERMKTIENFAQWVAGQDLRDLRSTDRHIALQSRLVGLGEIDFLGRMESFDADFASVCNHLGLPAVSPERRNQSTARGVTRDNASDELRSIVEEKYRLDYQIFGY